MKPRPPLPPGPYLVVGLARSGVAAALALAERGERVVGVDDGSAADARLVEARRRLREADVEVHLDASGAALAALPRARAVVKSPGVPAQAPVVATARERGVPVLGELELAWRLLGNEFVGVTGTNGKTTTTEWIGHIHRQAGRPVAVVGNVGTAASSLAARLDPEATVVCEASSFQLEDTLAFAPEVALLLNLAPDHLDRHGTYQAYVQAKLQIFARQGNHDVAIAPAELAIEDLGGCARRITFGTAPEATVSEHAGHLWFEDRPLVRVDELSLPGAHNRANAMAAAAACVARGLEPEVVAEGLRSFPGVPHRLELVCVRGGVAFVNDSKATNVASTLVALASYEDGVHLIAGGLGKGQDFRPLAQAVAGRCRAAYLIGRDAPLLAEALEASGIPLHASGDLARAVEQAATAARPGETVLLSPACASYDQFGDFEQRGDSFRALAEAL